MKKILSTLVLALAIHSPVFANAVIDKAVISQTAQYSMDRIENIFNEYKNLPNSQRKNWLAPRIESIKQGVVSLWYLSPYLEKGDTYAMQFLRGLVSAAFDIEGIEHEGSILDVASLPTLRRNGKDLEQVRKAVNILAKFLTEDSTRNLEDFAQYALSRYPNGLYQTHLNNSAATNQSDFAFSTLNAPRPIGIMPSTTTTNNRQTNSTRDLSIINDSRNATYKICVGAPSSC